MEISEYKTMSQMETYYWWYVGRREIIRRMLSRYITTPVNCAIDLGCGTGVNYSVLTKYARRLTGLDTSPEAVAYCRARGIQDVQLINDPYHLDITSGGVELVTMFDVLEHIEDDAAALGEIRRILQPGGLVALTVPAYQFLWSEHDLALHHYRRYTRRALEQKFEQAGYRVIRASYIISSTLPGIVAYRGVKGILNRFVTNKPATSHVVLPRILNDILVKILYLEALLVQYVSIPFGTSIVLLAQKE